MGEAQQELRPARHEDHAGGSKPSCCHSHLLGDRDFLPPVSGGNLLFFGIGWVWLLFPKHTRRSCRHQTVPPDMQRTPRLPGPFSLFPNLAPGCTWPVCMACCLNARCPITQSPSGKEPLTALFGEGDPRSIKAAQVLQLAPSLQIKGHQSDLQRCW